MIGKLRELFPEGTPVILKEGSTMRERTLVPAVTIGTVVEWKCQTTGAWYSGNGHAKAASAGGKLQLLRLRLRKADGEITDAIIDDLTSIAKLEAR